MNLVAESDILLSAKIQQGLVYIISDWSTKPIFDLSVYHIVSMNYGLIMKIIT